MRESHISPLFTSPRPEENLSQDDVARLAYDKWERRNRTWDFQLKDWLEAEAELDFAVATMGELTEVHKRLNHLLAKQSEVAQRLIAEHDISRILNESDTLTDVSIKLTQVICECFEWDVGAFWLLNRDANHLHCVEVWTNPLVEAQEFERESRSRMYSIGLGFPGQVWARQSVVWMPDVTTEPSFLREDHAIKAGLHGAIGFPIFKGTRFLGLMEFFSREILEPDDSLVEMMASISGQISQFLERKDAENQLESQKQELSIARTIQLGLLPQSMPDLPGFSISGKSIAINVGGDSFDVIPLPKAGRECFGLLVADACGHGMAAALLAAQTHAYLRGIALTNTDTSSLLQLTNQCLCQNPNGQFVTALLLTLNSKTRTLDYAGAGHLPGYVLDSKGHVKALLPSAGLPLGMIPAARYPASLVRLARGDFVVLLTDGITEAMSPAGEFFGAERALEVARNHRHELPETILNTLFAAVGEFCEHKYHDDLTALILRADD